MTSPKRPAGFTLLELVVVLAVLAILTGMAVASFTAVEDQTRVDVTIRTLEGIRDAVAGNPDERDPDGTRINRSFVSDIGRLPRTVKRSLVDDAGITRDTLTLDELWIGPTDPLQLFELRQATVTNLDTASAAYVDSNIYVGTGWRGPYLSLGTSNRLRDGHRFLIENPALSTPDSSRSFFRTSGDLPIGAENIPIEAIRPGGANGLILAGEVGPDANEPILDLVSSSAASLKGTVEVKLGSAAPTFTNFRIQIRVYGPSADNLGKIRASFIHGKNETSGTGANFDEFLAAANGIYSVHFAIPNLSVGTRAIRAYLVDTTTGTTVYKTSTMRRAILRSGINDCSLEIGVND